MQISFKEGKGFYPQMFLTCFLIIISLGLYLPWGMTNIRKEIWSRIRVGAERLYYIGRAKELLFGYIIMIVLFGSANILRNISATKLLPSSPLEFAITSFGSILFFTIIYKAQIGSFRYQVNRTVFKGVRFTTDLPSVKDQYLMCFKWGIITYVTFGLSFIYFTFRADQIKYNSLRYGSEQFSYGLTFKEYGRILLKGMLQFLVPVILVIGAVGFIAVKSKSSPEQAKTFAFVLIPIYVIAGISYAYIFFNVMIKLFKLKVANIKSQNISLKTNITFGRAVKHYSINALIMIFTLGIGFPIALANNIKLYANTLSAEGADTLVESNGQTDETGISQSIDDVFSDNFDLNLFDAF